MKTEYLSSKSSVWQRFTASKSYFGDEVMNACASKILSFELAALITVKFLQKGLVKRTSTALNELAHLPPRDFCYLALTKVSRSFAVVIQKLSPELRDAVCVFYLVLRGLDTIEDDMAVDVGVKVPLLTSFYEKLDLQEGWSVDGIGYKDEKSLLQSFNLVIEMYQSLKPSCRSVISRITKEMGAGMAKFAGSHIVSIDTTEQYDEYCHYVAGLVGIGLTDLFQMSGLEDRKQLAKPSTLTRANSMGLFLQKTNIIRDYLEDMTDGRTWWPEDIWSNHASELEWFSKNPDAQKSVNCLNEMVCNALQLLPHCLDYMELISDPHSFQFCAVPQVMAIATLAKLYNNKKVFRGVVKIRKGLSAKLMIKTQTYSDFQAVIHDCSQDIVQKMDRASVCSSETEPEYVRRTRKMLEEVMARTAPAKQICDFSVSSTSGKSLSHSVARVFFFVLLSIIFFVMFSEFMPFGDLPRTATQ